jgi:hypothetical protein
VEKAAKESVNHGSGSRSDIIVGSIVLDRIRYFREMPGWLKMPVVLWTALAAVTNLAEGLALAQ